MYAYDHETGVGPYTGKTGVDLDDKSTGETDWAGIVAATLGGTAAIIRAAEGTPAPTKATTTPTFDPYAQQKKAAGVPMWVWLGGGALVLVVLMGQRR